MNELRGPCSNCGAALAIDQRYCIECGTRVGAPLALPYVTSVPGAEQEGGKAAFALPIPIQTATTFAAMALGFGVVMGTAISPNLSDIVASSPPVVAEAPSTEEPAPSAPIVAGGGGPPPSPSSSAVAAAPVSSGTGTGGGGGAGKKKKNKKKKKKKADTLAGVVVHVNPVAVSYSIASVGNLKAIHTDSPGSLPAIGTDLSRIPVRPLRNGTYAETGARTAQGSVGNASFSGTVTYCADTTPSPQGTCDSPDPGDDGYVYTVSAVGSSVLVRVPSASPTTVPRVGQTVTTAVRIDPPFSTPPEPDPSPPACEGDLVDVLLPQLPVVPNAKLLQSSVTPGGAATGGTLEAVVEGRCPGESKLVLSADDIVEALRELLPVTVGAGIDQAKLYEGQPVMAAFNVSGVGDSATLHLTGVGSDHGVAGADDPAQGYGTLTR
jgi:hypothetical protein